MRDVLTEKNQVLEAQERAVIDIHKPPGLNLPRRNAGYGKGTFVESELFTSSAFLSLRGVAPQMLILFLGKRNMKRANRKDKKLICSNDGDLKLTYIELEKLDISQPRATRGLDDLLGKGFIEVIHRGGAYRRDQNVYALSDRWRQWRPGQVFSQRDKIIRRGFQGGKRRFQHTKP